MTASTQSLTRYREWNWALAHHFFPNTDRLSGKPAYLQVDEDSLEEIARKNRPLLDAVGRAESDFLAAVRALIDFRSNQPFAILDKEEKQRLSHATPWFLGFLGLTVLAASKMADDKSRRINQTNYYVRLRALLDLPESGGKPPGFEHSLQYWEQLRRWLDIEEGGTRGKFTAEYRGQFRFIGPPLTQCLLREQERETLPLFFRFARIEPEDHRDLDDLVVELKHWARNDFRGPSARFRHLLLSENNEILCQIATLVESEARAWDGKVFEIDEYRKRQPNVRLLISLENRLPSMYFSVSGPPDFTGGPFHSNRIGNVELVPFPGLTSTNEFSLGPLNSTQLQIILDEGLELNRETERVTWKPDPVIPLVDDDQTNEWLEVERVRFGEPCCLLVRSDTRHEVDAFLAENSEPLLAISDNPLQITRKWLLYRGVRLTSDPGPEFRGSPRLVPPNQRLSIRFEGGLRFDRAVWLSGAEPLVHVIAGDGKDIELLVDNEPFGRFSGGEAIVDLRALELNPGRHSITANSTSRHFDTLTSGDASVIADRFNLLGFVFSKSASQYTPLGPLPRPISEIAEQGQVAISGLAIFSHPDDLPQLPVTVWDTSKKYFLLGARPGQVMTRTGRSAWDQRSHLSIQIIELTPHFQPVWLMRQSGSGKWSIRMVGNPIQPEDKYSNGDVGLWKHLLSRRKFRNRLNKPEEELRLAYQRFASGLII